MGQRLRIFVSSPGDVMSAREVAAQVIEKVAQDYRRFFTIEPYLWEYEPMLASGHFQDSIDPPSHFDAVILILESRLGLPLPERTAVREYRGIDGRTPVTGTEWEFEDALAAARERGLPDLLVYRSQKNVEISTLDSRSRQATLAQIEALETFWSRHFAHKQASIGGYSQFKSLEEFSTKFEQDLRRCVQRRIERLSSSEQSAPVQLWAKAPFRGLEAYEFEHAPIFFGRDEAIGAALLRLLTNAQEQRPFLLILGASGSGKSSLVKAGVVPRLLVPQRVSGTAFLGRVLFRPSDAHGDESLFDALARCISQERTGLPGLLGTSMPLTEFAQHLREASGHPGLPFAMVLDRMAEEARARGRMLKFEQAKLILIVDQLEELFTAERVQPEERTRFVQLLAGLARSGRVWVIATMRADFWHRAGEIPELIQLADGLGRLDLLPPTPAELSQMIRRPADAAAISFEIQGSTGIPLNDLIAEEAAREPGTLPLLSYLLDQLYQRDVHEAGGSVLTYASYTALGGLKGAIATRADAVVAAQPQEVRAALRQVLFALVQMSATDGSVERAVARRAALSDFPQGTPKRRFIQALLDPSARLLVADAVAGHAATVRLAHEALISEWQTARDFVSGNAEALKTRRMLEERYTRWSALPGEGNVAVAPVSKLSSFRAALRRPIDGEHGLLTDVDLSDARRLLQHYREELAPDLVAFVERSILRNSRRRQRTVRAVAAVAVAMAVLAIGAGYEARVASAQRDTALQAQQRSLTQTAAARLHESDVAGSLSIIFEVLRPRSTKPSYLPDALSVFQEARAADAESFVMTGHTDRVRSAAFSPDGKQIVTASADKTARIWDAATGRQLLLLSGHTDAVLRAAFSPDGKQVVTASFDRTARIWDAATGTQVLLLSGHTDRVYCAAFSPDGKQIATASADKTARIWDAATGKQVLLLSGHAQGLISVAFSPDGKQIVTASVDKTARIWDAATGRQLLILSGHTQGLVSAAFSPDGTQIVTGSLDKTARIWDGATGRQVSLLSGHTEAVISAAFSPDGTQVITSSQDWTARVWDTATARQVLLLRGHTDGTVYSAMFSPDGKKIATASADKTARIWDTATGREVLLLRGNTDWVNLATFSRDGKQIVTASADKTARIWDAAMGRQLMLLSGHTDGVYTVMLSPDGKQLVTASADKTARIWDAATGRQLLLLSGHTSGVYSAMFSPDGTQIVTASYDKTARIWDAATGRQLSLLSGHTDGVLGATFSPDGRQIVTASFDKTARIWDAATGRQILLLSGHTDVVASAAFSPNGKQIVTASSDQTARIWDAATARQVLLLSGHTDRVDSAIFSPDGKQIATASADKTARIWDAATGRQLLLLSGHTDGVLSAAFSPDGMQIVTASADKTARIWDARVSGLETQIEWAEAAQFDPPSATERFRLGLPRSSEVHAWPADATSCDLAAAAPYDPDRRAAGTTLGQLVPDIGLAACTRAGGNLDNDARLVYQHGRASMAHGDFADASRDFELAIGGGYRAAQIDRALLLLTPAVDADPQKAIVLNEHAWKDGVKIAAFQLGNLYEHGASITRAKERFALAPDTAQAWVWYKRGADAGEPNALARFAERQDASALLEDNSAKRHDLLLDAFKYYAAAAERARTQDWPDDAWRNWRYRRASLARILARDGMMQEVAHGYEDVRKQSTQSAPMGERINELFGINRAD